VNVTDGLDGLASGLLIISFGAFGVMAYLSGLYVLAMTGKTQLLNAAELQLTPSDIRVLQDTCTGFSELSLSSRDFKNSSDQCIKLLETVYQRMRHQKR
jgi:hypothetical protein